MGEKKGVFFGDNASTRYRAGRHVFGKMLGVELEAHPGKVTLIPVNSRDLANLVIEIPKDKIDDVIRALQSLKQA